MLRALAILLSFQLVGEILVRALALPVPGPVLGMLLLVLLLLWRGSVPTELRTTAQTLLSHLSLLFVPAGVGVMTHSAMLQREWLPLVLTLLGSTLIALLVTAATLHLLLRGRADGS
jgi:holin-like protein